MRHTLSLETKHMYRTVSAEPILERLEGFCAPQKRVPSWQHSAAQQGGRKRWLWKVPKRSPLIPPKKSPLIPCKSPQFYTAFTKWETEMKILKRDMELTYLMYQVLFLCSVWHAFVKWTREILQLQRQRPQLIVFDLNLRAAAHHKTHSVFLVCSQILS